jgi:hypothetical protein
MFMEIAIGAIGIGVVLMVGYLVISQVRSALPTTTIQTANQCQGLIGQDLTSGATCYGNVTGSYLNTYYGTNCGTGLNLTGYNTSAFVTCNNAAVTTGLNSTAVTIFAGFSLIAVGIIVLAAFGLINIFK